jgi:hypothetical protein
MNNPWKEISFEKRVLDIDKKEIDKHNHSNEGIEDRIISTEYFPEPFIGNPGAGIYLLLGNPGMEMDIHKRQEIIINIEKHAEYYLKNLRHEAENPNYPLFYLDPAFHSDKNGRKWWEKTLRNLEKDTSSSMDRIAKEIFVVETYGYHSAKGENVLRRVESSRYTHYLVKKAIQEKKLIIIARSVRQWFDFVPELRNYENCHFLASNRGIDLSEMTISPGAFNKIKEILK